MWPKSWTNNAQLSIFFLVTVSLLILKPININERFEIWLAHYQTLMSAHSKPLFPLHVFASLVFWIQSIEKLKYGNYHTGCPINNCIFFKGTLHCSYKNYPISKIYSLVSQQLIYFYVCIVYATWIYLQNRKSCVKRLA